MAGPEAEAARDAVQRLSDTFASRVGKDLHTVNIASRVETLNKELGTRILATGHVVAALGGQIRTRPFGDVELRGRSGAMKVYEVLAEAVSPAS